MLKKFIIELPDTHIMEKTLKSGEWEEGSLFDRVLRRACMNATPYEDRQEDEHHCSLWSAEQGQCSYANHPCPDSYECLDFN